VNTLHPCMCQWLVPHTPFRCLPSPCASPSSAVTYFAVTPHLPLTPRLREAVLSTHKEMQFLTQRMALVEKEHLRAFGLLEVG
jgi:hypothetical protein